VGRHYDTDGDGLADQPPRPGLQAPYGDDPDDDPGEPVTAPLLVVPSPMTFTHDDGSAYERVPPGELGA
jgi:hypothetical protein